MMVIKTPTKMTATTTTTRATMVAVLIVLVVSASVELVQAGVLHSGGGHSVMTAAHVGDGSSYGNRRENRNGPSGSYSAFEGQNNALGGFDSGGPFLPSIPGITMGLAPSQLQSLLSSFGGHQVDRIPAISEHVYSTPRKVVISGYDGPMRKFHGTIRSFHQIQTLDHGGRHTGTGSQSIGGHLGGMSSDYGATGYEDFNFPADW